VSLIGGLTLDTGALIALDRRQMRAWALIAAAQEDDLALRAPADILAEFWRGKTRSKALRRLIDQGVDWVDVTPALAKRAGEALAAVRRGPSAIDAVVATVAAEHGDRVITSDPDDFERLAEHYRSLRVLAV
jgi:predicted nucleic acid-binding protein